MIDAKQSWYHFNGTSYLCTFIKWNGVWLMIKMEKGLG